MSFTRRAFFTRSGLIAAGTLSAPAITHGRGVRLFSPAERPRRIIHLVSDGMSSGTLTCADALSHLRRGKGLAWLELYKNPAAFSGFMDMRSLNSLVTDSSAASSSWGSGSRINNGAVNVLPDGRELKTLYALFAEKGWKRGLVTTTEITHATPAGFAANQNERASAEAIALQYLERRIEVLLGGGSKFLDPNKRKDQRDLFKEFSAEGYCVMRSAADLHKASQNQRWLGIFSESHVPYTLDQARSEKLRVEVPSLADMTAAALHKLSREAHFILQVEGGRVDHGAHNCDAAGALTEQIAFDEALEVCLSFQERVPDTLIVITTDHGTGNIGLNGMGDNYVNSSQAFANLNRIRYSFPEILKELKDKNPAEIRGVIADTTGYSMTQADAALFSEYLQRKGKTLFRLVNTANFQLGQLLANYTGVSNLSGAHTADYVPITSIGPGAQRFRGFIQNTDVFYNYLFLARIDYRNPSLPLRAQTAPWREVENTLEYSGEEQQAA